MGFNTQSLVPYHPSDTTGGSVWTEEGPESLPRAAETAPSLLLSSDANPSRKEYQSPCFKTREKPTDRIKTRPGPVTPDHHGGRRAHGETSVDPAVNH